MTRRLPVIRTAIAPRDVLGAVIAAYPGAVLVADGHGEVAHAWGGPAAPVRVDGAERRPLHAVLGLADDAPAAGQLQLWLASAVGVDAELWRMAANDPPRRVPAHGAAPALELEYGPLYDAAGTTTAAVVFVKAEASAATSAAGAAGAAAGAGADAAAAWASPVAAPSPDQAIAFVGEARPLIDDCVAALTKLTRDRAARHAADRIFRAIHTLKGAARGAGLGAIAAEAHAIEDRLVPLRAGGATREDVDALRDAIGQLAEHVAQAAPRDEITDVMTVLHGAYGPIAGRVDGAFTAWQSRPRDPHLAVAFGRALDQLACTIESLRLRALNRRVSQVVRLADAARSYGRPERRLLADLDAHLQGVHDMLAIYQDVYLEVRAHDNPGRVIGLVTAWTGDTAVGLAAAAAREGLCTLAAVAKSRDADRVADVLTDLPRMFAPAPASLGARAAVATVQRALGEVAATIEEAGRRGAAAPDELGAAASAIRAATEQLTWVPLDETLRRVARQAGALAHELGKRVRVELDAFAVVVPEALHRAIDQIVLHAVRNAIDHGVEPPEERLRQGKRAAAAVFVIVRVEGGAAQLEIVDDGRGVDVDKVRARAVAMGLIDEAAAADATPELLHELVFHPGLSTAAKVGMVSGRGVGMDVIRAVAAEHGGAASLSSMPGAWTRLVVTLPIGR